MEPLVNVFMGLILFLVLGLPLMAILLMIFPSFIKGIFYFFVYLFTGERGTFRERKNKAALLHHRKEFEKNGFSADKIFGLIFPYDYRTASYEDGGVLNNCFHCIMIDNSKKTIQLCRLDNLGMFSRFSINDVFKIEEGLLPVRVDDMIFKGFYISFMLRSGHLDRIWMGTNQDDLDKMRLSLQLLSEPKTT